MPIELCKIVREQCGKWSTGLKVLLTLCVAAICLLIWTIRLRPSIYTSKLDSEAYNERLPTRPGYLRRTEPCTASDPCVFKIVADLDTQSRVGDGADLMFKSVMLEGSISKETSSPKKFVVTWKEPVEIFGRHNEGGRGMELSELILTRDGHLLSADDRTGIVYEHTADKEGRELSIPRHVITEGAGDTNKGMKIEWATEKDGNIWLGSFGKEYTGRKGEILNENNFWVVSITPFGQIKRYNWKPIYDRIRRELEVPWPGYCIHEAVSWSPEHRLWVFLPRRVSATPYDETKDERMGSNKMVLADENFKVFEVRTVGKITPERGFSTFKFFPGSRDMTILALKSEEEAATGKQRTFITAFSLQGDVYLEEQEIPVKWKFEGLEFIGQ